MDKNIKNSAADICSGAILYKLWKKAPQYALPDTIYTQYSGKDQDFINERSTQPRALLQPERESPQ